MQFFSYDNSLFQAYFKIQNYAFYKHMYKKYTNSIKTMILTRLLW